MSVLMLFLDGVGVGSRDPAVNPIYAGIAPRFVSMLGELSGLSSSDHTMPLTTCYAIDANLGVEGLPQSGTGQAALFTGVNAPKILGRHFGPYPHSSIRPLVESENIFRKLVDSGKTVCFANAFPQRFFDHINKRKAHMTVTTLSCLASGVRLLQADDLRQGEAVSADVTGAGWHALGYPDMIPVESEEAGRRLARLSRRYDFVLFEYWKTDHAGHSMNHQEATEVLALFDGLLGGILEEVRTGDTLLVITSDHGNIEDLTVKVHTRNPVPLIMHGAAHSTFADSIVQNGPCDLTSVAPAILRFLTHES